MHPHFAKAIQEIILQLKDQRWLLPFYLLMFTPTGMIFSRYNADGSFDVLVEDDPGYVDYPVVMRLIDSRGESVKAVIESDGYKFSGN